jgi:ATP-dependent DNA ligase
MRRTTSERLTAVAADARALESRSPRSVYEEKYDGWRILASKNGRQVRLVNRRGRITPLVAPTIAPIAPSASKRQWEAAPQYWC